MREPPALVLFCGGMGGSAVEDLLAGALRASALDLLDEALATGAFEFAVVVADPPSAAYFQDRLPPGVLLDADSPGEAFHFGRRLTQVIDRYQLARPVYVGCGLPLVKGDELVAVARGLSASEQPVVVANNFFSADLAGFWPGGIANEIELPNNDRILPRILSLEHGYRNDALPRTMANQFDLDSTGDLAVLAYAGGAGPNLTAYLQTAPLDTSALAHASRLFTDRQAEVLVAGRVGSTVWQYLEAETACRVRMYSEERGMLAAGRDISGEARSLLAFHLQAVGPRRFFEELAQMVHGAFIDTRPLLAHLGIQPSRRDRFLSDALTAEGISDPWLREFTAAAATASIPVVLGGSSLVTSGVQLLSEAAWREHDAGHGQYQPFGRARS